ncbi:MAG: 2Fe-2S iron-sulfur cluster-binding protein, partial [Desulfobacterales bacterium]|nr:2Fe-2S iron-sulfur cluster-binding protein [Desulfobacterales bacterium]
MANYRVHFLPDEKSIEVQEGSTVAEAAQRAELFINNLCGGEGVCGECRVRVVSGQVKAGETSSAFFSQEEIDQGFALACQTRLEGDLEIEIPPDSRLEQEQIMTGEGEEA